MPSRPAAVAPSKETLAQHVANLEAGGFDVLVYMGPINYDGFGQVTSKAPANKRDRILALLATFGGDAHSAYRIARFLRRSYESVTVYVPGLCKSAGTLVCIGAQELVISEAGELGPLDVQVREPNELFEFRSGLAIPQALEFLNSKVRASLRQVLLDVAAGGLGTERASQIAVNTVTGLYKPIYATIDAGGLGGIARELAVASNYAERLDGNLKPESLERLVSGYPSHQFVIDREEAEKLFQQVREPNEDEAGIASCLGFGSTPLDELAGPPNRIVYLEGKRHVEPEPTPPVAGPAGAAQDPIGASGPDG